jgi:hypothetical protein
MWTCPKCGSTVDSGYEACWSCGATKEGAGPASVRADEWTCPKCGETVDAGFEVCWSCGTSKEGVEDPLFERADEGSSEPHPDDLSPPPVHEPLTCLRCHGEMEEGFVADFRDGITHFPIRWYPGQPEPSFWTGTWSGGEPRVVRTFRCVCCGYLESYAHLRE